MKIVRRIGKGQLLTMGKQSCPDIFELDNGDYAIIGQEMTSDITKILPDDAGCLDSESIVVVPRALLILAKPDIPDA